jgi:hypothetical protein
MTMRGTCVALRGRMRVFCLLFLLVGCGGAIDANDTDAGADAQQADCGIDPSPFDTSCETSDDCQLVWFGDVCSPFCAQCVPNSAINVSSIPAYQTAFDALLPDSGQEIGCACPKAFVVATCNQGTCEATAPGDD